MAEQFHKKRRMKLLESYGVYVVSCNDLSMYQNASVMLK